MPEAPLFDGAIGVMLHTLGKRSCAMSIPNVGSPRKFQLIAHKRVTDNQLGRTTLVHQYLQPEPNLL